MPTNAPTGLSLLLLEPEVLCASGNATIAPAASRRRRERDDADQCRHRRAPARA